MEDRLDKVKALDQAKRRATLFLAGAMALFILSLVLKGPAGWMVELLRSISEAAMVGGLADWFAVAALFRPVNLLGVVPVFPSHTAVIPRSRDRIARSLGDFIHEHFLQPEALVALVRRHDPAQFVANWFLDPRNAEQFGRHGTRFLSWFLHGLHEEKVQALVARTIRDALKSVDLSRTAGEILEMMLKQGRHHELLDEVIAKLTEILRHPEKRANFAAKIAEALRQQYPKAQFVLPTEAIGRWVTGEAAAWVDRYLENVAMQAEHDLRSAFDRKAHELIVRLKDDSRFASKGEEIKDYILRDEKFTDYMRSLWTSLREMIERDLGEADSAIYKKVVSAGSWIGTALKEDAGLRESLNRQVELLVEQFGPELGAFVSEHIKNTIQGWDTQAMSMLVEENIGTDLQKIRINGTVIGGMLGGVLYAITACAKFFT